MDLNRLHGETLAYIVGFLEDKRDAMRAGVCDNYFCAGCSACTDEVWRDCLDEVIGEVRVLISEDNLNA